MILPVALFALASAGAIGTKADKDDSATTLQTEWIHSPNQNSCLEREVDCTTTNTGSFCMADENTKQVFRKNVAGQCSILLYKKISK